MHGQGSTPHGAPAARPAASTSPSVLLVVPPFRSVVVPALGASLLKANLLQAGLSAEILYLNLRFADRIGVTLYEHLGKDILLSTGDFVFSCVRFARTRDDIERYVREVLAPSRDGRLLARALSPRGMVDALEGLAREAAELAVRAADEIVGRRPRLVGFSSLFQENLACLAIARLIKERDGAIRTILGGANTEGEMGRELFTQFPELDYVGQGDGDLSLVALARELCEQRPPAAVPGILRRDLPGQAPPAVPLSSELLESSPLPDFADYFAQLLVMRRRRRIAPQLAMEASRGCWWGEKKPCRFCGGSGESFACRAKSAERVRSEMLALVERHGVRDVRMVDLMLAPDLARELFPLLAEQPVARSFWETSGGLPKRVVRLLARSGARQIQPGFEALNDRALRLLGKPTTKVANLQTLRWCQEVGIKSWWNYLCGMPGESDEELDELEEVVRSVHHLEPPGGAHLVRLQRFSRYFQSLAESGFGESRPARCYQHLYPFPAEVLWRLAFHFETEYTRKRASSDGIERLRGIIGEWRRQFARSRLEMIAGRGGDWVLDTRRCARRRLRRLAALERDILLACDAAASPDAVRASLPAGTDGAAVRAALDRLVSDRLVLGCDGRFLSLVVRRESVPLPKWPGGGFVTRRWTEVPGILRRLRVTPVGVARCAVTSLPDVLSITGRVISAVAWSVFTRGVKLFLGAREAA